MRQERKSAASLPTGLSGLTLAEIEAEAIRQTLEACQGNKSEAARRLGIAEKSIYNKIKRACGFGECFFITGV